LQQFGSLNINQPNVSVIFFRPRGTTGAKGARASHFFEWRYATLPLTLSSKNKFHS